MRNNDLMDVLRLSLRMAPNSKQANLRVGACPMMSHRQAKEQPVQENPAPIDVPVYHEPVQRASAADGAEENNGKPANDTPEQEADVPPDSRVPKRDAVYRSPTLGDSVVQMLHHMGRIFEDNSKADGTIYGLRIDRKRRRELQRKRLAMGHKPDDHEEISYT